MKQLRKTKLENRGKMKAVFKRIILVILFSLLFESVFATKKDVMVVSEPENTTELNLELECRMLDEELWRSIEVTVDFDQ